MKTTVIAVSALGAVAVAAVLIVTYIGTMTLRACLRSVDADGSTVANHQLFSSDYREARGKFLDAARDASANLESIEHPQLGPDGEPLYIDVAYFGNADSANVLTVISGTHGVEGFAGSAIQTGVLREGIVSRLPANTGLLIVHALNPYGMAHLRRFNEENIDLNRNFRDLTKPFEKNQPYDTLAEVIAPTSIGFWAEVRSWTRLLWYKLTAGKAAAQAAVSEGQYSHPKGLFYGGDHETWSNAAIHSIMKRYVRNASQVAIIDVHTGLGKHGDAEVILNSPSDSPEYINATTIWGPILVKTTETGRSISPKLSGTMKLAFSKMLPNAEVTAVSLEYGTVPPMEAFKALRAENWLHHHGGSEHVKAGEIKACLLRAFYPGDKLWKTTVWTKGKDVVERAIENFEIKQ